MAQGFTLAASESISEVFAASPLDPYFYTQTVPGLVQFGEMVINGEFEEVAGLIDKAYIALLREVERMAGKELAGEATYEEAVDFGQNLVKVIEGIAAIGTGAAVVTKAVQSLSKLFPKLKERLGKKLIFSRLRIILHFIVKSRTV